MSRNAYRSSRSSKLIATARLVAMFSLLGALPRLESTRKVLLGPGHGLVRVVHQLLRRREPGGQILFRRRTLRGFELGADRVDLLLRGDLPGAGGDHTPHRPVHL